MGKSLDFVKQRIIKDKNFKDKKYAIYTQNLITYPFDYFWKTTVYNLPHKYKIVHAQGKHNQIEIAYDPDADFNTYLTHYCIGYGNCKNIITGMGYIANDLLTCNMNTLPEDYDEFNDGDDYLNYDIKYTVGDFVIGIEYENCGSPYKPNMKNIFYTMLPVKTEFITRRE